MTDIKETIERLEGLAEIYASATDGQKELARMVYTADLMALFPAIITAFKELEGERDRLREALTKIANHPLNLRHGEPADARQAEWESGEDYGTRRAAQVARKALEPKP